MALAARAADLIIGHAAGRIRADSTAADRDAARIDDVDVAAYTVPHREPEADGTLAWDATTAVVVHAHAGRAHRTGVDLQQPGRGRGRPRSTWPASSPAATRIDVAGAWEAMHRACRNLGTRGLVMQAISAVDIALWDLKARLLGAAARRAVRAAARDGPDLRLGRVHHPDDAQLGRAGRAVAASRLHRDEDQDRPELGRRRRPAISTRVGQLA